MYACGLRISEAATLEVTSIDGRNGLIRVVGKGNKERSVPLPEPVLAELRRLWKAHGNRRWLCPNAKGDGPITHRNYEHNARLRDRAAHVAAVGFEPCGAEVAEDVRNFQSGALHECTRLLRRVRRGA